MELHIVKISEDEIIMSMYSPVCGQGPHLFEDAGVLGAVTLESIVKTRIVDEWGDAYHIEYEEFVTGSK